MSRPALSGDFETTSVIDLKKRGLDVYADPRFTEVSCFAFAFGDEPVDITVPPRPRGAHLPLPERVADHVRSGGLFNAWNAQFELMLWNRVCVPRYGWPPLKIEQMRCTMAASMAMSMPAGLGDAADALRIGVAKDHEGSRIMLQLCKPRSFGKPTKAKPACERCAGTAVDDDEVCSCVVWWNEPEKFQRLYAYCKQDVETERAISKVLLPLSNYEQRVWQLDQKINQHGVRIDVPAVHAAIKMVDGEKGRMNALMREATAGHVAKCTESKSLTEWLSSQGVVTPGVAKNDVKALLDDDELPGDMWNEVAGDTDIFTEAARIDGPVRTALKLRQEANRASTAKLMKMLQSMGADEIVRFMYQYYAAHTGRWGGRRVQPQNMTRPAKHLEDPEIQERIMLALLEGWSIPRVCIYFGSPMEVIASVMRGFLLPLHGREFMVGDFSNIEGRGLSWLAGDEDKLDAYRRQDDGTGPEIYIIAGAAIFGVDPSTLTRKSPERQIGKVSELACIAMGQRVLTDRGLVPIEFLSSLDRVWDGEEFVKHSGVVYRGDKDVISYDGLWATPDHIVWVEGSDRPLRLDEAAACGARLAVSGVGRFPIRLGGGSEPREALEGRLESADGACALHGMHEGKLDRLLQPENGTEQRLPELFTATADTEILGPRSHFGEGAMQSSALEAMGELRRQGYSVRVRNSLGSRTVGDVEPWSAPQESRVRPDRQRQGLRARQSSLGDSHGELREQALHTAQGVGAEALAVLSDDSHKDASEGSDERTDNPECVRGGGGETQKLALHTKKAPTFDILNCGPRNRFTVAGKLVHNCGFQGGVGAFKSMARIYGVHVTDLRAEEIKEAWRDANTAVAGIRGEYGREGGYWKQCEQAAKDAINYSGRVFSAGYTGREVKYVVSGSYLMAQLPSKRCLYYPYPELRQVMTSWGKPREAVTFMTALGNDKKARARVIDDPRNTNKYARISTYGGSLTENNDQAVCRDLQADSMLRVDAMGLPIAMHTHDEIVAESAIGAPREVFDSFTREMAITPAWAKGMPVVVDGFRSPRYRK